MNGLYLQLHAYVAHRGVPRHLVSKQMRKLAHIARTYDKNFAISPPAPIRSPPDCRWTPRSARAGGCGNAPDQRIAGNVAADQSPAPPMKR
jgi:hypothetical protein